MSADEVKIVVVDDERDTAETLATLLEMDGYAVKTAGSGVEALPIIETFQPLCVLMDINMPGGDGHELSSRLRTQYGNDMILIAVTGWGHADERISSAFARFDHYLRKPIDLARLKKLLPPI